MIKLEEKNGVVTVMLNRPELHNAFNAELIAEGTKVFRSLEKARLVVLTRGGSIFLRWSGSETGCAP